MNLENVNKAINVMTRVKNRGDGFDLCIWQGNTAPLNTTEDGLHRCGTSACLAGWIAVSPEFQEDGGRVNLAEGQPEIKSLEGHEAIAFWFDIALRQAGDLCGLGDTHAVYCVDQEDEVTVDGVLAALYRLRDTGSVYTQEDVE